MDNRNYLAPGRHTVPDAPLELTWSAAAALQSMATVKYWHRDQEIIEQDSESKHWYCVISGSARQSLVRRDGRRQIADILLPGDFFGLEVVNGHHWMAVQALTEGTVTASYPRPRIEALADRNHLVAQEIREQAFRTIRRLHEQTLLVGTMTAEEKVHGYFRYMHGRLRERESDIALPVSRYDIADQLGISVETVCRAITSLRNAGVIDMDGPRNFHLREFDADLEEA
ncbi:MAG TPA: cyclic nucleotide-binding domain-containing protein [Devosiaceae bacterium]|nr:cyclic nucleotide-binding domain-containing protein [Devosiaceae bacterium]